MLRHARLARVHRAECIPRFNRRDQSDVMPGLDREADHARTPQRPFVLVPTRALDAIDDAGEALLVVPQFAFAEELQAERWEVAAVADLDAVIVRRDAPVLGDR